MLCRRNNRSSMIASRRVRLPSDLTDAILELMSVSGFCHFQIGSRQAEERSPGELWQTHLYLPLATRLDA